MPAWQTSVASISSARIISTGELYDDAAFHKLARTFAACLSRAPYTFSYRCGWLSQGSLLIARRSRPGLTAMEKLQNVIAMRRETTDDNDRCTHHERTASRFLASASCRPVRISYAALVSNTAAGWMAEGSGAFKKQRTRHSIRLYVVERHQCAGAAQWQHRRHGRRRRR